MKRATGGPGARGTILPTSRSGATAVTRKVRYPSPPYDKATTHVRNPAARAREQRSAESPHRRRGHRWWRIPARLAAPRHRRRAADRRDPDRPGHRAQRRARSESRRPGDRTTVAPHVAVGTDCRDPARHNDSTGCGTDPYSSIPATSGPHWDPSGSRTGVSTPRRSPRSQLIHNLEHGGIVIWYDAEAVTDAEVDEMASYVEGQVATGSAAGSSSSSRRGAAPRISAASWPSPRGGTCSSSTQWTWTPFAPSPTGTT